MMQMTWTSVDPIVKTVPRVQATVYVNADGKPRVRLTLSEAFLNETGHPERAHIQTGVGAEGDCFMRLLFDEDGKFEITGLGKGGARISNIPASEPMPDGARDIEACDVVESKAKGEVIIKLPLKAWAAQLTPAPAPVPPRQAAAAAPAKPNGHTEPTEKFDVVAYLMNKGMKITREGDGYREGRELHSKASILTIANRYRRAAELPDLRMADIA